MADNFNLELLNKKWIHSHEEDHGNEKVYRPPTYKFPPSRGRSSFELAVQGALKIGGPGPDDRQFNQSGNWEIEGDYLVFRQDGSLIRKMKILSVTADKLVLGEG